MVLLNISPRSLIWKGFINIFEKKTRASLKSKLWWQSSKIYYKLCRWNLIFWDLLKFPNQIFHKEKLMVEKNWKSEKTKKSVFGLLFPRSKKPKKRVQIDQKPGFSKLWTLTEDGPVEIAVEIIATNQRYSAVRSGTIQPETNIIIDLLKERPWGR